MKNLVKAVLVFLAVPTLSFASDNLTGTYTWSDKLGGGVLKVVEVNKSLQVSISSEYKGATCGPVEGIVSITKGIGSFTVDSYQEENPFCTIKLKRNGNSIEVSTDNGCLSLCGMKAQGSLDSVYKKLTSTRNKVFSEKEICDGYAVIKKLTPRLKKLLKKNYTAFEKQSQVIFYGCERNENSENINEVVIYAQSHSMGGYNNSVTVLDTKTNVLSVGFSYEDNWYYGSEKPDMISPTIEKTFNEKNR